MLKVINKTKSKMWISDFCFVPGESEVKDLTEKQYKEIKSMEEDKFVKECVKEKLLSFEWDKKAVKKFEEVKEDSAAENAGQ